MGDSRMHSSSSSTSQSDTFSSTDSDSRKIQQHKTREKTPHKKSHHKHRSFLYESEKRQQSGSYSNSKRKLSRSRSGAIESDSESDVNERLRKEHAFSTYYESDRENKRNRNKSKRRHTLTSKIPRRRSQHQEHRDSAHHRERDRNGKRDDRSFQSGQMERFSRSATPLRFQSEEAWPVRPPEIHIPTPVPQRSTRQVNQDEHMNMPHQEDHTDINYEESMRIKNKRDREKNLAAFDQIKTEWQKLKDEKQNFEQKISDQVLDAQKKLEAIQGEGKKYEEMVTHYEWWDEKLKKKETKLLVDCVTCEQSLSLLSEKVKKQEEEEERFAKKNEIFKEDQMRLEMEKKIVMELLRIWNCMPQKVLAVNSNEVQNHLGNGLGIVEEQLVDVVIRDEEDDKGKVENCSVGPGSTKGNEGMRHMLANKNFNQDELGQQNGREVKLSKKEEEIAVSCVSGDTDDIVSIRTNQYIMSAGGHVGLEVGVELREELMTGKAGEEMEQRAPIEQVEVTVGDSEEVIVDVHEEVTIDDNDEVTINDNEDVTIEEVEEVDVMTEKFEEPSENSQTKELIMTQNAESVVDQQQADSPSEDEPTVEIISGVSSDAVLVSVDEMYHETQVTFDNSEQVAVGINENGNEQEHEIGGAGVGDSELQKDDAIDTGHEHETVAPCWDCNAGGVEVEGSNEERATESKENELEIVGEGHDDHEVVVEEIVDAKEQVEVVAHTDEGFPDGVEAAEQEENELLITNVIPLTGENVQADVLDYRLLLEDVISLESEMNSETFDSVSRNETEKAIPDISSNLFVEQMEDHPIAEIEAEPQIEQEVVPFCEAPQIDCDNEDWETSPDFIGFEGPTDLSETLYDRWPNNFQQQIRWDWSENRDNFSRHTSCSNDHFVSHWNHPGNSTSSIRRPRRRWQNWGGSQGRGYDHNYRNNHNARDNANWEPKFIKRYRDDK